MRKFSFLIAVLLMTFAAGSVLADHEGHKSTSKTVSKADAKIYGEYLETRNADIYTGHCFANSEIGVTGDQAIMAWRIQRGSWNGVKLDGLIVVGVIKASATLGGAEDPYPARAVLIVDARATSQQQEALKGFAQTMGGLSLANIVRTEVSPISFAMKYEGEHPAIGSVKAGSLVAIQTRMIEAKDHICGHEEVYFAPLAETSHAMPAVATLDEFRGEGLGVSWVTSGKRSAFVGNFAR